METLKQQKSDSDRPLVDKLEAMQNSHAALHRLVGEMNANMEKALQAMNKGSEPMLTKAKDGRSSDGWEICTVETDSSSNSVNEEAR